MHYAPLYEILPELARSETRSATVRNSPILPDGEYILIEAYCNDPTCDCRRVMFNVCTAGSNKLLAVVAYGWESKSFYARWFGKNDPVIIQRMQGPILNPGSPQSKLAPALLQLVSEVLQDKAYVARLQRHYALYKQALNDPVLSVFAQRYRRLRPKSKSRRKKRP